MINSICGWDILNLPIDFLSACQVSPSKVDQWCMPCFLTSNETRTTMLTCSWKDATCTLHLGLTLSFMCNFELEIIQASFPVHTQTTMAFIAKERLYTIKMKMQMCKLGATYRASMKTKGQRKRVKNSDFGFVVSRINIISMYIMSWSYRNWSRDKLIWGELITRELTSWELI